MLLLIADIIARSQWVRCVQQAGSALGLAQKMRACHDFLARVAAFFHTERGQAFQPELLRCPVFHLRCWQTWQTVLQVEGGPLGAGGRIFGCSGCVDAKPASPALDVYKRQVHRVAVLCAVRTKPGETLRATVSISDCNCASSGTW